MEEKKRGEKSDASALAQKTLKEIERLSQTVHRLVDKSRSEKHRMDKEFEQFMAIVQPVVDLRGAIKRAWPLFSETDQEKLRSLNFQAPREDRG